jgi:hypothetical protein
MHVESDLTATAILGPWVKPAAAATRRQQVYLSLAHWYEAAKFMPHKPDLRDALLYSPSVKEAKKFARKRQKDWRSDWPVTRHSVLVAGMAMLSIQRPELELERAPLEAIRTGLAPLELPERFLDACLERFEIWRGSPRLCVFGADSAPDAVVGTRLAKLVSPLPTWTLVTSCHKRTAWRVHDWALAHYVPVSYLGSTSERPSRPLATAIIESSDQVLVFEQRRNKRFDHVLQTAKSLKKKVVLELFDGEDAPTSQLPIA